MPNSVTCSALLVAAPASGEGKTTWVAAVARYYRRRGLRVRVFKTGPDFIDPMIHEIASGAPVHQIDLWMVGEEQSKQLLYEAACDADLLLVEGVMGLFDGNPSSADLATAFGLPVVAVLDASSMAQTFGALALGLASYRDDLNLVGVVANRVASDGHSQMLKDSLPNSIEWLGGMPRSVDIELPERHLGLYQATDIADIEQRLDAAAELVASSPLASLPPEVTFIPPVLRECEGLGDNVGSSFPSPSRPLQGQRIAVAKDKAFSFIYPANVALLERLGADISYFSPLMDSCLGEVDSVYLPGGYPELYLDTLAANQPMKAELRAHYLQGKPMVAECGGMLYLLQSLAGGDGKSHDMVGVIPATASLRERLAGLGLQAAEMPHGAGVLRGHTFHYSAFDQPPVFNLKATRHPPRNGREGEGIYLSKGLLASFVHWYFPSNPEAAAQLFLSGNV